jgi:hypothetical protein
MGQYNQASSGLKTITRLFLTERYGNKLGIFRRKEYSILVKRSMLEMGNVNKPAKLDK